MDYTFDPWLEALGTNGFEDDPLLVRLLAAYAPAASVLAPPGMEAGEEGAVNEGTAGQLHHLLEAMRSRTSATA